MDMVYLGLFQKIFNWVYNKILGPVVDVITQLFNKVFDYVFNNILEPMLELVANNLVGLLKTFILKVFGKLFYTILSYLLKLIDYISKGYDIFIGNTNVTYYDSALKQYKTGPLLQALFATDGIGTAFRLITVIGMGIALLVAIYAIIKSTLDFDFENKRPVGAVLRSLFRSFIQFLLVPIMLMVILNLSAIVLSGLNVALSPGGNQTLGSMVFFISSLDASKISSENISQHSGDSSYSFKTGKRGEFLNNNDPYLYSDMSKVDEYFYFADFDYVIGIIVSMFLIFILTVCIVSFIQRIFEIIILYLTAPLFIATTPLDDGEKFHKWRDMFVAKCFTGYGSIVAMKLYMILCPVIIDNSIQFTANGSSLEATYLIKLIFLIGGAWAFLKVGPMITTLLNVQAGMAESQSNTMGTGMIMQFGLNPAAGLATSALGKMGKGVFGGNKNGKAGGQAGSEAEGSSGGGKVPSRGDFHFYRDQVQGASWLKKERPPAPKMGFKQALGSAIYHSDTVGKGGRAAIDGVSSLKNTVRHPEQVVYKNLLEDKGRQRVDKLSKGLNMARHPVAYGKMYATHRLTNYVNKQKAKQAMEPQEPESKYGMLNGKPLEGPLGGPMTPQPAPPRVITPPGVTPPVVPQRERERKLEPYKPEGDRPPVSDAPVSVPPPTGGAMGMTPPSRTPTDKTDTSDAEPEEIGPRMEQKSEPSSGPSKREPK